MDGQWFWLVGGKMVDAGVSFDLGLPPFRDPQAYREWDFSNMLTLLLRFNGRPVAAAVMRVFGQQLAELPLVATRPDARRQGHARVLVRAIESTLTQLGVQVRPIDPRHCPWAATHRGVTAVVVVGSWQRLTCPAGALSAIDAGSCLFIFLWQQQQKQLACHGGWGAELC